MDLDKLAETIRGERARFETAVEAAAKSLRLEDVTSSVLSDPNFMKKAIGNGAAYSNFQYGSRVDFSLKSLFHVFLYPHSLTVSAGGIGLAAFEGDDVTEFYGQWYSEIIAQRKVWLEDVPF